MTKPRRECSIDECHNIHLSLGYCNAHYLKFKRFGNPLYTAPTVVRLCNIENCKEKHFAKNYCIRHYVRYRDHGDPLFVGKVFNGCKVKGCSDNYYSSGYCCRHYHYWLYRGKPAELIYPKWNCEFIVCTNRYFSNGYCKSHYKSLYVHPLKSTWMNMIRRCTKPKSTSYHHYGGRGIAVCERWLESFDNFIDDMGQKPSPEYTLDRIDNDGNYEPSNCRWATPREQALNKRPRLKKLV